MCVPNLNIVLRFNQPASYSNGYVFLHRYRISMFSILLKMVTKFSFFFTHAMVYATGKIIQVKKLNCSRLEKPFRRYTQLKKRMFI